MLTKLMPDQVSKFWDIISFAVEQSLPPIAGEHPDKMNRILSSCLCGKTDVWLSYVREEDIMKVECVVLTRLLYDDASDTRSLLIYCLYGLRHIAKESWLEGYEALIKYAKKLKCTKLSAYTNESKLINIAENLGAESVYTFLSFDLNSL